MSKKPIALIILDGYGYAKNSQYNAVTQANTPYLHKWIKEYPHAILKASGSAVGLADGIMGNSEVGHMAIGTGQVQDQPLVILNEMIQSGELNSNQLLIDSYNTLNNTDNALQIIGLLSDAGVHAHIDHMIAFVNNARAKGVKKIYVHAILDGRDTPPKSAFGYLEKLESALRNHATLASIHGRFFAMDRDNNWERTAESMEILLSNTDEVKTWQSQLNQDYSHNITDEFIPPTLLDPQGTIKSGDGVIFCNVRPDRARQLTKQILDTVDLSFFITPVAYDQKLQTITLIEKTKTDNPLLERLIDKGLSIFSIAETEKYAHITYFFSGGREDKYDEEVRVLIPSIKVKSYADTPCMSAVEITDMVLDSLESNPKDFYLINYANADMVGHSGNFEATKKALECVDEQLGRLYHEIVEQNDGTMYITSDHGNAEVMYNEKAQQPATAHTANPVPFIMIQKNIDQEDKKLPLTELKDIASFITERIKK
ncbi:MAG TPA: 2,3-bisphosphoglycerate-independent phosphoglycerate mutase [Candidatus Babeliales bacterium]|nr:2,3-bisphosphoglycerate-independent phosphoglycerate mutase [Candidatus Babeliales bacterium]